jgi:hypothetical protein
MKPSKNILFSVEKRQSKINLFSVAWADRRKLTAWNPNPAEVADTTPTMEFPIYYRLPDTNFINNLFAEGNMHNSTDPSNM